MLFSKIRLSIVALFYSVQLATATCAADNCLRAVIASAFSTRDGLADCESYFMVTVSPATVTSTQTITQTATFITTTSTATTTTDPAITPNPNVRARQATLSPTAIPAYASACSGAARYSSACSCIGASPSTTTLAVPSATALTTLTATTTTTYTAATTLIACANPSPTFILRLSNSGIVLNGIALDGTYANLDLGDGTIIGFNGVGLDEATPFSLTEEGNLIMDETGQVAYLGFGQAFELVHFDTFSDVNNQGTLLVCSTAGGMLGCAVGPSDILQLCPGEAITDDVFLGNVVGASCVAPTFNVVMLCEVGA